MDFVEKGATKRITVVTNTPSTGAAVAADSAPTWSAYSSPDGASVATGTMTAGTDTGVYFADIDTGAAAYTINGTFTVVVDGIVSSVTGRVAFDFEVIVGFGRMNNLTEHVIATGKDTIKQRDGSTTLRTITPTETGGTVTVTPS